MGKYDILEQVKIRIKQYHIEKSDDADVVVFDNPESNPIIEQIIDQAKKDVIAKRCYPQSYTEEEIESDLEKHEAVIVNLTIYDLSQAGEEFMSSFSENGVSRTWRSRDDLFVGVFPFVQVP